LGKWSKRRRYKYNTSESIKEWLKIGDYKLKPNVAGNKKTTSSNKVKGEIKKLLDNYSEKKNITLDDILDFRYRFESMHLFQDRNSRVGRLIMFKECLRHNITPFIIDENHKLFYYRGLKEYENKKGYLRDTCLSAQDDFKKLLSLFEE
jgi:Fic family protein